LFIFLNHIYKVARQLVKVKFFFNYFLFAS
jgi:hypothetical protein